MSFLSLLFYIYIIAVPLSIAGFGMWLMRYMTRMEYAREKRTLFTVIVIACLTFIAVSLGYKLNKASSPTATAQEQTQATPEQTFTVNQPATEKAVPQQTDTKVTGYPAEIEQLIPANLTEEDKLRLFEIENFPGLYEQRTALSQEIKDTILFFKQINKLAEQTPKQRPLLRNIAQIRKNGYDKLDKQNVSVSQYLREFWVHYSTGDSHDATRKFTPVAEQLEKKIKETRGQLIDNRRQEARLLSSHMVKAGAALKTNKIPRNQKIVSYSKANRQLITDWLNARGSFDILDTLSQIIDQRSIINERINKLQSFKQEYKDLNKSLSRTLDLWRQAKESNYYAEYRLLYASESRYVYEYLNLEGEAADKRLDKELQIHTNTVAQHADVALDRAEQAYKPNSIR